MEKMEIKKQNPSQINDHVLRPEKIFVCDFLSYDGAA